MSSANQPNDSRDPAFPPPALEMLTGHVLVVDEQAVQPQILIMSPGQPGESTTARIGDLLAVTVPELNSCAWFIQAQSTGSDPPMSVERVSASAANGVVTETFRAEQPGMVEVSAVCRALVIPPDALVITEHDNSQTIILPQDRPVYLRLPDNFQGTTASGPITLEPVSDPDFSYIEWRVWPGESGTALITSSAPGRCPAYGLGACQAAIDLSVVVSVP